MSVDGTTPNISRIYDYVLGGHHNFEADRAAAEQLIRALPWLKNSMLVGRWFMYAVVEQLAQSGFDCFLDLASGLPTQGYVHEIAPNARVLYNDIDPVTVAYAREILGANPLVRYFQSDIANLDTILVAADEHFGGERRVAICMLGISYFLSEQVLQRTLKQLYEWCAPGSQLAFSWLDLDPNHPQLQQMLAIYQRIGTPIYFRETEQIKAMLGGWQIMEPGIREFADWVEMNEWNETVIKAEQFGNAYGVVLTKG